MRERSRRTALWLALLATGTLLSGCTGPTDEAPQYCLSVRMLNLEAFPVPGELRYRPVGAVTEQEAEAGEVERPFRLEAYPKDGHWDQFTASSTTATVAVDLIEPQGAHSYQFTAISRGRAGSAQEIAFEEGGIDVRPSSSHGVTC